MPAAVASDRQVNSQRSEVKKSETRLSTVAKRDKRQYRRYRWRWLRAGVELSRLIRRIEFTQPVKRHLVDLIKQAADAVQRTYREIELLDRQLKAKTKRGRVREADRKRLIKRLCELRTELSCR